MKSGCNIYLAVSFAVLFGLQFAGKETDLAGKSIGTEKLAVVSDTSDWDEAKQEAFRFLVSNATGKYSPVTVRELDVVLKRRFSDTLSIYTANREILRNAIPVWDSTIGFSPVADVLLLNSDSLRKSVDRSFSVWNNTPWKNEYSKEIFQNYILPYRVAGEPLEYYWKSDAYNRYSQYTSKERSIAENAQEINLRIPEINNAPQHSEMLGYTVWRNRLINKCDDRSAQVVMALRSVGIPAAVDFTPCWASHNSGHSFITVILPNDSMMTINGLNEHGDIFLTQAASKIYRRAFAIQDTTVLYKAKDFEPIPSFFNSHNLIDVTSQYPVEVRNVRVQVPDVFYNSNVVYLAVFSLGYWKPVAYAQNRGPETVFRDVGTGARSNGEYLTNAENKGRGALYMPAIYSGIEMIPVGDPIIIASSDVRSLKADTVNREEVVLARKYPLKVRISDFADKMIDGIFEGANVLFSAGSEKTELHYVAQTPLSHMQSVEIADTTSYKFVRYYKPTKNFSVAEIKFFGNDGEELKGLPIYSPEIFRKKEIGKLFDSEPLTYFEIDGRTGLWVGLEFDRPQRISRIEFCPRTDDNDVRPGDSYELFYWDSGWVSLGEKMADGYELVYGNVPGNALLWLRNLSRGKEERPFTYENGCQIWW